MAPYLAAHADTPTVAILVSRIATISKVHDFKIRSQTEHAGDVVLARYVRDGELFVVNAAGRSCDNGRASRGLPVATKSFAVLGAR